MTKLEKVDNHPNEDALYRVIPKPFWQKNDDVISDNDVLEVKKLLLKALY